MRITLRLSKEDGQRVKDEAREHGMTVSGLIRDMIRNSYEQMAVSDATHKIDKLSNDLTKLQKDAARTLQIVTLLGQASPLVSRQM